MSLQTPSSAHPPLLRKPICRWNEWLKDELSWGHQLQQTVTSEHNKPSVSDPPCNRRPCARCWPGLGQVRRLTWACSILNSIQAGGVSNDPRARTAPASQGMSPMAKALLALLAVYAAKNLRRAGGAPPTQPAGPAGGNVSAGPPGGQGGTPSGGELGDL